MYNKIAPDIQMLMRQNHQPIGHERTTRGYNHHLVHALKRVSIGIFECHDAPLVHLVEELVIFGPIHVRSM